MDLSAVVTFITGAATTELTALAIAGLTLMIVLKYFKRARGAA